MDISLPTVVVAVLGIPETIIGFLEYLLFLNMLIAQSNVKEKKYQKSIQFIKSLNEEHKIDYALKYLYNEFENWIFCGFYRKKENQLEISTYHSDNIPCSPIHMNGVCGQSITNQDTIIVNDVSSFENHITCDSNSKSEIAIPFTKNNIEYVLDIDSKELNGFDQIDKKYLQKILKEL